MEQVSNTQQAVATPPIQPLATFIKSISRSPITGWRFQKRGWLETINIAGRPYVTAEAVRRFIERAEAGEFAKQHPSPKRTTGGAR